MVFEEATHRRYNFDASKFTRSKTWVEIPVTSGQMEYERQHLLSKLIVRDPELHSKWEEVTMMQLHPMFKVVEGAIEGWEIIT